MIVAGLDLSLTSAGVAILVDGEPRLIRSVGHKGKDVKNWHNRIRRITSQTHAVTRLLEPFAPLDFAALEQPLTAGPDNSADSYDRYCVFIGVCSWLQAKRVPFVAIHPNTLKLWFTGDGHASKQRMTDTARARFRQAVSTNDEADAIAAGCAGMFRLGDPIPFEPRQRQIDALLKVEWPEVIPCR